ncbi:glycosyltransferase [Agrobacterium tumefaciens]|uniref:glycosyltransferase n=1 Tax=Agrobacterium tumefaciens TaxID=358 RepID=UPI001FAA1064|nr:glycosyltransferase [Agrobacterium tumefaciens]UNZ53652.1 glycosyltransferase [Agrobacterium tumefaciens]
MSDDLDFTGERYVPAIGGNIYLEHMHRYHLAKNFVANKDVLDIASGEGFGSALLAQKARSVVGVDISDEAVLHAQEKYKAGNISFKTGSCEAIPLPSASVDVVVSFETLEHIDAHELFLQEVKRVLRPGGVLVISTPEKDAYTVATGLVNPFHVKELFKHEFDELLSHHFAHVSMHGQKIGFGSIIAPEKKDGLFFETDSATGATGPGIANPMYMIAVASDDAINDIGMSGVFSQDIQSSEPVLKRVEFEEAQWFDAIIKDIDHISGEVDGLQRGNWMSRASTGKLLLRLTYVRLLYALSKVGVFSERRRKRFLKSAEKRDPMLLSRKVDQFCLSFYQHISANKTLARARSYSSAQNGIRITAIVPNFNHARFLPQRLDSILAQTYPLIDILVLDDCSSDDSRSVIDSYVKRYPERIRAIYNSENSGNVFRQWQKGHSQATGDLVWICESDDFCEPTFVERTISAFRDPSVMLAFGRIQFANNDGNYLPGLDHYREESEPGIWDTRTIRPAATWFRGGFGVKNVIANVGGSLWRRFDIPDSAWEEARSFKIMGDWYLYSVVAGGGQIAYEPGAVSYFRIHDNNTSGSSAQAKPEYYKEYFRLMAALKARWKIPNETLGRFLDSCRSIYRHAGSVGADFDQLVPEDALRTLPQSNIHVLVGILGFSFGGGEIFPIHLANALYRKGIMVSILQMHDADDHPDVRRMLNSGIPVYTANAVRDMGVQNFLKDAGISVVNSHVANVEAFLLEDGNISIPYLATLHGSYEAMDVAKSRIERWSKSIDKFAYTADRNLAPFEQLRVPREKFLKVPNAMPVDEIAFPKSRAQLGIADNAVVFSMVARGAEGKGWEDAVKAYLLLRQRQPDVPMALLMVGEGPSTEAAKLLAASDSTIHFLGFVKEIYGLYRISDVALLPTRFPGESFPLCLIQALQVGVPCVATDIGEIRAMSKIDDKQAGIIISNTSDTDKFVTELTAAMEAILNVTVRDDLKGNANALSKAYDIDLLADEYIGEYRSIITRRFSAKSM